MALGPYVVLVLLNWRSRSIVRNTVGLRHGCLSDSTSLESVSTPMSFVALYLMSSLDAAQILFEWIRSSRMLKICLRDIGEAWDASGVPAAAAVSL